MVIYEIKIDPIPKPRMVRSDKWAKREIVQRYFAFCKELRFKFREKITPAVYLMFYIPMPKSWSEKKKNKMRRTPHQQRPDIDNLCKSVLDALCEDDSYIYHINAGKAWDDEGSISIGLDEIIV